MQYGNGRVTCLTLCAEDCQHQLPVQLGLSLMSFDVLIGVLLHVAWRDEATEGKAPRSSECTADTVRDSRQGVVLQPVPNTGSSSLRNSCASHKIAHGFTINKRRAFVNAVMNIQIPKMSENLLC